MRLKAGQHEHSVYLGDFTFDWVKMMMMMSAA